MRHRDDVVADLRAPVEAALAQRILNDSAEERMSRVLAQGDGWTVADVVCTAGPPDRPFEERHAHVSLAIVAAGTFQYRSAAGRDLMTPGSLLLGNAGHCFECGHEHGTGDRSVAFWYDPDYFARVAADAGAGGASCFRVPRLPPLRALSSLVAQACTGLTGAADVPWAELSLQLAARTVQIANGVVPDSSGAPAGALARVTRTIRAIERRPDAALALDSLAGEAGLSPYHFLRTFERLTGVTPHQYVLRTRLRAAAVRIAGGRGRILDVALECGFGDVSNFNRAFRAEFGISPRAYRLRQRHGGPSELHANIEQRQSRRVAVLA